LPAGGGREAKRQRAVRIVGREASHAGGGFRR
jgi:hypothetical protein